MVTFTPASLAVITALVVALTGAIGKLFQLLIAAKDSQYAAVVATKDGIIVSLTSEKNSYRRMLESSVETLEQRVNMRRAERGEPPLSILAAVVPEHDSPITYAQQSAADLATLKARMVAVMMALEGDNHKQEGQP